jgi:hypothetical protein
MDGRSGENVKAKLDVASPGHLAFWAEAGQTIPPAAVIRKGHMTCHGSPRRVENQPVPASPLKESYIANDIWSTLHPEFVEA